MENSSCHVWPLMWNRAKEFLLPQVWWPVVSLNLCCAYSLRWCGSLPSLFQICTNIFNFWCVVWQDTFMYDEACKEGRGSPSIMLEGMPHPQQLLNYWGNCVYQVHVIHTENSSWIWTISNIINLIWWGRNKAMKKSSNILTMLPWA